MGSRGITRVLLLLVAAGLAGCLSDSGSADPQGGFTGVTQSANAPPRISGSPDTAVITGKQYAFTPAASDADGDALSFSIKNKPNWADFDKASGRLSGLPLLGDQGVYNNITISVSDGDASSSMRSFSITVTDSALGSMTLSWTIPTENTDGTPLTDLAGYHIYFGKSKGNYSNQVRIENPSINTYVVESLLPDTYYVVATSFNAMGIESTYSNVATRTVSSN